MNNLPTQQEQIIQVHASLIVLVVQATQNTDFRSKLTPILKTSAENGWQKLVNRIQKILDGERSTSLFNELDDEDRIIIEAILKGINDPASLPDANAQSGNPGMAAPGIAHLIHQAGTGNTQALTLVSNMAEQMSHAGGDMARLASITKKMIDGERDPEVLSRGMGAQGAGLVTAILDELAKLQLH